MKTEKIFLPAILLLLVLIIMGLLGVNRYLRKQNMLLVNNFNLLAQKIEALESEMRSREFPPINPERVFMEKKTEKPAFRKCIKEGNKGYLIKKGQSTTTR